MLGWGFETEVWVSNGIKKDGFWNQTCFFFFLVVVLRDVDPFSTGTWLSADICEL